MKKEGTRRCLHQDTKSLISHNHIPTSLFLPRPHISQAIGCQDVVLFALPNAFITNKQTNNMLKQNKDVGMGL